MLPHELAVIGGGRWARVLIETLCGLLSPSTLISLHSKHCSESHEAWLKAKGLINRVGVSSKFPVFERPTSAAVIVSNAARDHKKVALFALYSGVSVLVEKPLDLSLEGARELVETATERKVPLAASNVFLFAEYIYRFANVLANRNEQFRAFKVRWVDPTLESRYGELKTFDPGLPVFLDALPHVSSILGVLVPDAPQRCQELRLLNGGAQVELQLALGNIPCHVVLARNGRRRERSIEVTLNRNAVSLDFTVEPGTIIDTGVSANADPDWFARSRPLELMLGTFLQLTATGKFDRRISVEPALCACALSDQVLRFYNSALASWLTTRLTIPEEDEHLRYALNEILQSDGPLAPTVLEHQREKLKVMFSKSTERDWIPRLVACTNRRAILKAMDL